MKHTYLTSAKIAAIIPLAMAALFFSEGCSSSTTPPTDPVKKYAIKGKVVATTTENVSGVIVAVPAKTTTTDAGGNYSIGELENGSYVVTPTKAGMTILPATQNITVNGADATATDFVARTIPTYEVPVMVSIEPGTFMMGAIEGQRGGGTRSRLVHQVTLTKGMWVAKYEVTQKQYESVMGTNPTVNKGDNKPVANITIIDMAAYCNKLSELEGLTKAYTINATTIDWNRSANGYRLPTSAEWEYFARAGTIDNTYAGICDANDPNALMNSIAWYAENSVGVGGKPEAQVVGQKIPNQWGLYDVLGNLSELCFESNVPYTTDAQTDPWFGCVLTNIEFRGGNFAETSSRCLVSDRFGANATSLSGAQANGIRLVRTR